MPRYTQKIRGQWILPADKLNQTESGFSGEAVHKLSALEQLIEDLLEEQQALSSSMAQLRAYRILDSSDDAQVLQ